MAQNIDYTEARNYRLSNGQTVDLVALVAKGKPAKWVQAAEMQPVGTVVYAHAMGDWRRGVVVKNTPTKTFVALTTQAAVDAASGYFKGQPVRVQIVEELHTTVYVAPAPVVETVAKAEETLRLVRGMNDATEAEAEEYLAAEEASQPPRKLDATGSGVVRLLERVWARIREDHADLPEVVIVTGAGIPAGKWGHFRADGWKVHEEGAATSASLHEMFMAGETLAKGADQVLQTMLHEGAHTLARVRDLKDTSRQGRWHNQVFRTLANEMGLEHPDRAADKTHGYSFVRLTEKTRERYADLLAELEREIQLVVSLPGWLGGEDEDQDGEKITGKPPKEGGSTSGNLKAICECEEPTIIRLSRKVLDKGTVRCGDCDSLFTAA